MQNQTQDLPGNLKYTIYDFIDRIIGVTPDKKKYMNRGYSERWDLNQLGVCITRRVFPGVTNQSITVIYGTTYTIACEHVWPDWSGLSGTKLFKQLDFYITGNMHDFMNDVIFYRLSMACTSSTL